MTRVLTNVLAVVFSPLLVLFFVAWLFLRPRPFRGDRL